MFRRRGPVLSAALKTVACIPFVVAFALRPVSIALAADAQLLASGLQWTNAIAVDGDYVYFGSGIGAGSTNKWTLNRTPKGGGPIELLATDPLGFAPNSPSGQAGPNIYQLAVAPTRIVLAAKYPEGDRLFSVNKVTREVRMLPPCVCAARIIGVTDEYAYVSADYATPFWRISLVNPQAYEIVGSNSNLSLLTATFDPPFIYYVQSRGYFTIEPVELRRLDVVSGDDVQVLDNPSIESLGPRGLVSKLATDQSYVYFDITADSSSTNNRIIARVLKGNFNVREVLLAVTWPPSAPMGTGAWALETVVGEHVYFQQRNFTCGPVSCHGTDYNLKAVSLVDKTVTEPLIPNMGGMYQATNDERAIYWYDTSGGNFGVRIWKLDAIASAPPLPPSGQPSVSVDRRRIDFGSLVVGALQSGPETVVVVNSGEAPLAIHAVSVVGANAADFSISSSDCPLLTLVPNASCSIRVVFAPLATGLRTASVSIVSNAPGSPHLVDLAGSGIAAPPSLPPAITKVAPLVGPAGTAVTIAGHRFGIQQSSSVVLFGTNPADNIVSWSDTQIVANAPANGNNTGPVSVTVRVGDLTSNASTFTYTTATRIEARCEKSLLNLKYWAFYKNTCELIDTLRREFRIASDEASTDALFNWLKSTDPRTGASYEAGLVGLAAYLDYGRRVADFIDNEQPLPTKTNNKRFASSVMDAADVLANVLDPILQLIELTPAQAIVYSIASTTSTIVLGLQTFEFGIRNIAAPSHRYVLQEYMRLRRLQPRDKARETLIWNAREDIDRTICLLYRAEGSAKCSALVSDPVVVKGYLDWVEAQYMAYSLYVATPEQRDAIGNAIARTANGG
jgi:hypothetical protein